MTYTTSSHLPQLDKTNYYREITDQDIGKIARELLAGRITKETSSTLLCSCPNHDSKSKQSLTIDASKQIWNCWACNVGGDVLHLVEFIQSKTVTCGQSGRMTDSHRRARDWLAKRKGLPLLSGRNLSPEEIERLEAERAEEDRTFQALTTIAEIYHERLMHNNAALDWLYQNYAISEATIKDLKIGYADNGQKFPTVFRAEPYSLTNEETVATGAVFVTKDGTLLPFFQHRITFPYWYQGRVVYMIGRRTPWTPDKPNEASKYKKLLTHDEEKHKHVARCISNRYLYNEDLLVSHPKEVIITEGVTDCIAGMERGFPMISPVTTHLAAKHFERVVPTLQRVERVTICMDAEASGKGLDGALDTARSLQDHNIGARIAVLPRPEGTDKVDINTFFKDGGAVEDFRAILDKALSLTEFSISQLPARIDSDSETKLLKPIIEEISKLEPLDRDRHLKIVHAKTGLALAVLKEQMKLSKGKAGARSLRAVRDGEESGVSLTMALQDLGIEPPSEAEKLILPSGYIFDGQGTGHVVTTAAGPARHEVAPCITFPIRGFRDLASGEESVEIVWLDDGHWRKVRALRGCLVDARSIITLANRGVPVSSVNSREFVAFHHNFLARNTSELGVEQVSSQFGWVKDDTFLWGDKVICNGLAAIRFDSTDPGTSNLRASLQAAGTFEEWQTAMKALQSYPRALAALYAAFVPPLLKPLGGKGFVVDLCGKTSIGKTTVARAAASVWGVADENESNGFIRTWDTTNVGAERRAIVFNDLLCVRDETKRAKSKKAVQDLIYTVVNGVGRDRGTRQGIANAGSWRTVLISTGESALNSFGTAGGARARILQIRGKPFDTEDRTSRALVDGMNRATATHYGHAGPAFVEWLLKNQDRWQEFRDRRAEKARAIDSISSVVSGEAARLADAAACISLAGELAHEAGIFPWEYSDPIVKIWTGIEDEVREVDVGVRALRDVHGWCVANESSFFGHHNGNTPREWFGRWDDPSETIDVLPHKLKRFLEAEGYEYDACIQDWREKGWLAEEKGRRGRRIYLEGRNNRFSVVSIRRAGVLAAEEWHAGTFTSWPGCMTCVDNKNGICQLCKQNIDEIQQCCEKEAM